MVITNEARTKTKQEIIQELKEKNILDCETWKGGGPWRFLEEGEEKEIGTAIFENIKRNPDGWRTQKVRTINYVYAEKGWCNGWFSFLCPKWGALRYIEDEILLLHKSAEIKYDERGVLIKDYRRIQVMTYFTEEQKVEITELLQQSQPVASTSQFRAYIEQPTTNKDLRLSHCHNY
jgi:hypothetical protein